jgi:hypothetical protein
MILYLVAAIIYAVVIGEFGWQHIEPWSSDIPKTLASLLKFGVWAPVLVLLAASGAQSAERANEHNPVQDKVPHRMSPLEQLWNGDFRLPIAFWRYHLLGGICVLLLGEFVTLRIATVSLSQVLIRGLLFVGIGGTYLVISTVGTWRSAANYPGRGIWMRFAKAAIVLATVSVVAVPLALTTVGINVLETIYQP